MKDYKDNRPAELNKNGCVNCIGCKDYDSCIHRNAARRNPREAYGLALCHRLSIKTDKAN